MKKLIVFSVIFAMLATVAFAEVSVGAWGKGVATLMGGDNVEGDPIYGSWDQTFRAEFSAENEDGTFGGYFRVIMESNTNFGNVWWKPIDQLRLWIGKNPDGEFGADDIVSWGFMQGANDAVTNEDYSTFTGAFNHGFGAAGLALSIFPMDGLTINLAIPYGLDTGPNGYADDRYLANIFGNMIAQVRYEIDGLGRVVVTFRTGTNRAGVNKGPDAAYIDESYDHPYGLFGSFLFTAIENLTVHAGLGANLPINTKNDDWIVTPNLGKGTIYDYFNIGLGAEYVMGDFGVKARMAMGFGAGFKPENGDKYKAGMTFAFAVLPYYDLGMLKAFLNAGIDIKGKDAVGSNKADYTNTFGFWINPYLSKSVGSGTFYAGFLLDGYKGEGKDTKTVTSWAVPIGITFGF